MNMRTLILGDQPFVYVSPQETDRLFVSRFLRIAASRGLQRATVQDEQFIVEPPANDAWKILIGRLNSVVVEWPDNTPLLYDVTTENTTWADLIRRTGNCVLLLGPHFDWDQKMRHGNMQACEWMFRRLLKSGGCCGVLPVYPI